MGIKRKNNPYAELGIRAIFMREQTGQKFQPPTSKHQRNPKNQPHFCPLDFPLEFEAWSFSGAWG